MAVCSAGTGARILALAAALTPRGFCLTVDRQAPRYATRIFGRDFAVLSRAERLPRVLTMVLGQLVKG